MREVSPGLVWVCVPLFLSFLSQALVLLPQGVGIYPGCFALSEARASEDWPCMTLPGACDKQTHLPALTKTDGSEVLRARGQKMAPFPAPQGTV